MFPSIWRGLHGIYGGYVLARVVEEAQVIPGFSPLSVGIQFMGAIYDEQAEWHVEVQHTGRYTASVNLAILQPHTKVVAAVKLGRGSDQRILDFPIDMSTRPHPDSLERFHFPTGPIEYESFIDQRLVHSPVESRRQRTEAWVKLDESVQQAPELGPFGIAAVFLDVQPPGLFFTEQPPIFVPSVNFTLHFAPNANVQRHDWMFLSQETVWATRDFSVEESQLYTKDGHIVAQLRQTRRVLWERP